MSTPITIGLVAVSDRASTGEYVDAGIPALKDWLSKAISTPWQAVEHVIADEQELIATTLQDLVDKQHCDLVLTTGGTGPAARDVTPEATLAIADKVLDGFGERMRAASLQYTPTAILSRQVAVTRGSCLLINLPGQPKAIAEHLDAIFAAVPYCIELIGGPRLDTNPQVITAWRPAPN